MPFGSKSLNIAGRRDEDEGVGGGENEGRRGDKTANLGGNENGNWKSAKGSGNYKWTGDVNRNGNRDENEATTRNRGKEMRLPERCGDSTGTNSGQNSWKSDRNSNRDEKEVTGTKRDKVIRTPERYEARRTKSDLNKNSRSHDEFEATTSTKDEDMRTPQRHEGSSMTQIDQNNNGRRADEFEATTSKKKEEKTENAPKKSESQRCKNWCRKLKEQISLPEGLNGSEKYRAPKKIESRRCKSWCQRRSKEELIINMEGDSDSEERGGGGGGGGGRKEKGRKGNCRKEQVVNTGGETDRGTKRGQRGGRGEEAGLNTCYCCVPKTSTCPNMTTCSICMPHLSCCPRTGFTRENLEWLEQMFRQALGHKQELSFDDFKKIVHSRNSFFAERVFQIFDRDNSGTVSLSEFLDAMHQFAGKSPNDKIKFLFRVYDLDGDGLIQQSELQKVMKACMEENGMRFSDEQIQDLTLAMFEDADTQNTGAITYESLKAQLEKHDGLIENLSISIDRWLVPPNLGKSKDPVLKKLKPYQMSLPYLKNNYVYLSFLLAYIAVNLGLFISRAYEYRKDGPLTMLARACGQCLNFNCMFVCVLVLRQSITYLRSMGGASFLPLDQHLYLHKLCGILIFIYSVLHTIAHLFNFGFNFLPNKDANKNDCTYAEIIFTMCPEVLGLIDGIANPTGVALMIILTVMVVCSLPFVRKSGYFEVFYWTHLLYIAFWTLCILHGPNFWKWFVAPGVIFLIERVHRSIRMRTGSGKTYISSGVLLPSKVIHLVIKRTPNFHFHPGDYVFLNIPVIANYEWHPFTISSAPEQDDVLWLHIRAVGQWTRRLYDYFEKEQQKHEKKQGHGDKTLQAALTLPDGSKALPTLIGDGRSGGAYLSTATTTQGDTARKNGIANLAYEHDGKGGATEGQEDAPVAATRKKRRQKAKDEAEATKDQQQEDGGHHEDSPSSLEGGDEGGQQQWEGGSNALYRQPRRNQATSFKYMRRKPRVVTLNLPSETESVDGDAEDSAGTETERDGEGQEERHGKEMRLTVQDSLPAVKSRDLAVAEEGRVHRKSQDGRRISQHQQGRNMRKLSRLEEAMVEGGCVVAKPLVVYMDGPFGAPSSHIFRAQHAVLIATGIGVTPFASILQSIMHKYWKARHTCPRCSHTWTSDLPQSVMNLRKVDFFWINRDQRSFEWFVNLLSQLEIEQAEQGGVLERFLDMHMYITSALQKTDMKAVGLQLALDLLHEKEKRDLITGLKTRTNAGRPNWDKVFKQLTNQQKGKITVFYCGPPALGRTLRYKCDEYGFEFRKEIF